MRCFFFAEREGFEPPEVLPSTVFKTAAFNRSAISPKRLQRYAFFYSFNKIEKLLFSFLNIKYLHPVFRYISSFRNSIFRSQIETFSYIFGSHHRIYISVGAYFSRLHQQGVRGIF